MLIFYKTGKFLLNSIGELPISNRSANSMMEIVFRGSAEQSKIAY
jgi:hypothetical protein